MPSYSTLPHMAVLDPDTSYKGAPRPRMGISSSTTYTNKLLSPGHERVRQGISTSSHLALFDRTDSGRLAGRREVGMAALRRRSTGAKPAPAAQFSGGTRVIVP